MKYIKRFNENTSIFNVDIWKSYLPNELEIVTNSGSMILKKSDVNLLNQSDIQISYHQNTSTENNGEPDYLEFDIHIVKENSGYAANSKNLKFDVDITYGDSMVSEFSIELPNKVSVIHYTGKGSLYDPDSFFGFSDKSLNELVNFFNRFGFKISSNDLSFIDEKNE
jgi:hypothetical protein